MPEDARQEHHIDGDVNIPPMGHAVLANSDLPGGFTPDWTYANAFDLRSESGRVRVAIRCGQTAIAKADLPLREEIGRSYSLGSVGKDGKRRWCMASTAYNRSRQKDDFGTPGLPNDCN